MLKIITVIIVLLLFTFCSNENNVDSSKEKKTNEIKHINDEKRELYESFDSLNEKIKSLKDRKTEIQENLEFYEVEIFEQVKNAKLDHVIIGALNFQETSIFFNNLGFSIKDGYKHKNGISNNFIEFIDNSEIEIIEISESSNTSSENYKSFIDAKISGLQFAIRVNEIKQLKLSFEKLNFPFIYLDKNKAYSTLSSKSINTELPIFFIKYNKENNNTEVNHTNKTKGIKSIWFETKDIKKSAGQLVDFGFDPIGNYKIPSFNNKVVEFRNNNFGIILIESNKYEISGITISIESLSELQQIMNKNFDRTFLDKIIKYGKSIFLPREITKSLWLEFVGEK